MEIVVYILAGFIAGTLTGLVGLSAAAIIAPIFATVLGMNPFTAIGIALASDVFASGIGAVNYYHSKNIHIKRALVLTSIVVVFAVVGSWVSFYIPPFTLNSTINIFVFFLGIRFIVLPVKGGDGIPLLSSKRWLLAQIFLFGSIIGFMSGFFGAGGGLSILALLTMVLKFDIKKAVGTSLVVMTFTALVGAIAHFIIEGNIMFLPILITSISAVIGAYLASLLANRINDRLLSRIIGGFLILDGVTLIVIHFWF